jgi:hypothetical protein
MSAKGWAKTFEIIDQISNHLPMFFNKISNFSFSSGLNSLLTMMDKYCIGPKIRTSILWAKV